MELPEDQFSNALLRRKFQAAEPQFPTRSPNNPEKNSADRKFLGRSFHRRKSR
jgi:hypothetical protein